MFARATARLQQKLNPWLWLSGFPLGFLLSSTASSRALLAPELSWQETLPGEATLLQEHLHHLRNKNPGASWKLLGSAAPETSWFVTFQKQLIQAGD